MVMPGKKTKEHIVTIGVRLTMPQYNKLASQCKAAKQTISDFVREKTGIAK